jgi:CRP-like cAMP-binding protein
MVRSLFDQVNMGLDIQKKFETVEPGTNRHDEYLNRKLKVMKKSIKLRKQIKIDSDKLKGQVKKFENMNVFRAGDHFGELALLYDVPRALSIAAT